MKKFTTFVCGPVTLVETDVPETVVLQVGGVEIAMSQQDFKDMCSLDSSYNGVKFARHPKEPTGEPEEPQAELGE